MNKIQEFIEESDCLDAEEKMTLLTDTIHSLFRGYVNGSFAHKKAHLKCIKDLEKAEDIIGEQATMLQKKQTKIDKLVSALKEIESEYATKFDSHNSAFWKITQEALKELEK